MNPAKRRHQISHANIGGIFVGRTADFGDIEETEDIQAVIDGDLHHIVVTRHLRALVRRQFVRRAEAESSAMHVKPGQKSDPKDVA